MDSGRILDVLLVISEFLKEDLGKEDISDAADVRRRFCVEQVDLVLINITTSIYMNQVWSVAGSSEDGDDVSEYMQMDGRRQRPASDPLPRDLHNDGEYNLGSNISEVYQSEFDTAVEDDFYEVVQNWCPMTSSSGAAAAAAEYVESDSSSTSYESYDGSDSEEKRDTTDPRPAILRRPLPTPGSRREPNREDSGVGLSGVFDSKVIFCGAVSVWREGSEGGGWEERFCAVDTEGSFRCLSEDFRFDLPQFKSSADVSFLPTWGGRDNVMRLTLPEEQWFGFENVDQMTRFKEVLSALRQDEDSCDENLGPTYISMTTNNLSEPPSVRDCALSTPRDMNITSSSPAGTQSDVTPTTAMDPSPQIRNTPASLTRPVVWRRFRAPPAIISQPNSDTDAAGHILLEGDLQVKGDMTKQKWRQRRCLLRRGQLDICFDGANDAVQTELSIRGGAIRQITDKRPLALLLDSGNGMSVKLDFKESTAMREWLSRLRKEVDTHGVSTEHSGEHLSQECYDVIPDNVSNRTRGNRDSTNFPLGGRGLGEYFDRKLARFTTINLPPQLPPDRERIERVIAIQETKKPDQELPWILTFIRKMSQKKGSSSTSHKKNKAKMTTQPASVKREECPKNPVIERLQQIREAQRMREQEMNELAQLQKSILTRKAAILAKKEAAENVQKMRVFDERLRQLEGENNEIKARMDRIHSMMGKTLLGEQQSDSGEFKKGHKLAKASSFPKRKKKSLFVQRK